MINPFISINQQLEDVGWKKYFDNDKGFKYVLKIGVDVYQLAEFRGNGIRFYDDTIIGHDYDSIEVDEKTLELFAAKIKEWRKQYGRPDKSK